MVKSRPQDTPSEDFEHEQEPVVELELCQPGALDHILLLKGLNKHYLDKFCQRSNLFYSHRYNQRRKCYRGPGQLPLFRHDRQ